jgi:hypothetical protein
MEEIATVCGLDPEKLVAADALLNAPWAVVRHGKLCYANALALAMMPEDTWSVTKTLSATITGAIAYRTRDIAPAGPRTGPMTDEDRVDAWLAADSIGYNRDARIGHVLAMVAHNANLALGQKTMLYDDLSAVQIGSLSELLNVVVGQDPATLGGDLDKFATSYLFEPLGLEMSDWNAGQAQKSIGYGWNATVLDMARLGLLLLNGGLWNRERLLDAEWIYRMTHPAFEDANTAYGYLTWLNARANAHYANYFGAPTGPLPGPTLPGPCAPVAIHREHPHGLSESPDCNYGAPESCEQMFDVGVWNAVGISGQVIQGHPGLDLVIAAKNLTPLQHGLDGPAKLWDAVRPAIVALDPAFQGDDAAFCEAYGNNRYAPALP